MKTLIGRRCPLAAMILPAMLAAGCGGDSAEVVQSRPAMDTLVTVRAIGPDPATAERAAEAAWADMRYGAERLDRHADASDLARVNRDAGGGFLTAVDPVVTSCLGAAKEAHDLTGGAFDPTVGPLLDLWRDAADGGEPPSDPQIKEALGRVGLDKAVLHAFSIQPGLSAGDPPKVVMNLVGLHKKGMAMDLGGVAKGYIVGRMADRMLQAGATAALVDAGGDVYAVGRRPARLVAPGNDPRWGVGIRDPRYPGDPDRLYAAIHIKDQAVMTSGHYERGYTIGGKRYSHILDPRTGRPVNRHLASVTVVGPDPALTDALATGIAVLGVEKGLALVETLPEVECLLLTVPDEDLDQPDPAKVRLEAHRSSGFAAMEFARPESARTRSK